MSLSERLALAMERSGINQADLARACQVKPPSVHGWLSGKSKFLRGENLLLAASALGVNQQWLATGQGPMTQTKTEPPNVTPATIGGRSIPVISAIQAGMWAEIVDQFQPGDADEYLLTDLELSAHAFALTIRGDSMIPDFNPGDRVIIDPEVVPHPGDFVAAKNGEQEATFKKYRPRGMDASGNMVFELVPLNDDYPTLRSDVEPIRIVGTMVEHRKYRRHR